MLDSTVQINPDVVADRLIELTKLASPISKEMEGLKADLRLLGANTYLRPGGEVKVTKAGEARPDGTMFVFHPEKLEKLTAAQKAAVFSSGLVTVETKMIKATDSKVQIKVAAKAAEA